MADITCLGYVVLGASDLKAWEDLTVDVLGLQVGRHEGDDLLTLRMDEHEQRVIVEKSDLDDFAVAGWEFDNGVKLEEFVQKAVAAGVKVTDGGKELAQRRNVQKVYTCDDPIGFKHEFYFGAAIAPIAKPFQSNVLIGPGFVTGRLGTGHFVPVSKDYQESVSLYRDVLGLRVSDYIRMELSPGVVAETTFFHTMTGRHHTIALTMPMPHPKRIRHISFQVQDLMDLGIVYDRAKKAGCLAKELGQHSNDKMLSFYVWSPSGFQIEYGWGGVVIDDADWKAKTYSEPSVWGHKPLAGGLI